MNKSERQAALARIINQKPIATQEELLAALKAAGIDATQATISRDIREMQIVKAQDAKGTLRYTIFRGSEEPSPATIRLSLLALMKNRQNGLKRLIVMLLIGELR